MTMFQTINTIIFRKIMIWTEQNLCYYVLTRMSTPHEWQQGDFVTDTSSSQNVSSQNTSVEFRDVYYNISFILYTCTICYIVIHLVLTLRCFHIISQEKRDSEKYRKMLNMIIPHDQLTIIYN